MLLRASRPANRLDCLLLCLLHNPQEFLRFNPMQHPLANLQGSLVVFLPCNRQADHPAFRHANHHRIHLVFHQISPLQYLQASLRLLRLQSPLVSRRSSRLLSPLECLQLNRPVCPALIRVVYQQINLRFYRLDNLLRSHSCDHPVSLLWNLVLSLQVSQQCNLLLSLR